MGALATLLYLKRRDAKVHNARVGMRKVPRGSVANDDWEREGLLADGRHEDNAPLGPDVDTGMAAEEAQPWAPSGQAGA